MNVGFIKADVVKFASKALLKARKNSPHILVGAGILGFVGTTVLASRETLKAQPLIKDAKGYKHMTDELYHDGKLERTDYAKELLHLYSHTSVQLLRVYSPAITVGALSIGAVLQSHHIMQQRNFALVAAYNTLTRYILGTVVKLRLSSARTKSVRSSSGCIKRVLSRHILMTEKFLRSGTVMTTTRAMLSGSTRALHISRRSKTTSTTRCS